MKKENIDVGDVEHINALIIEINMIINKYRYASTTFSAKIVKRLLGIVVTILNKGY